LQSITSNPSEAKNPLTFYDAMRVYTTGRHFVDVLSRNTETLLRPNGTTPTSTFEGVSLESEVDPLAQTPTLAPPPIPAPAADTPGGLPKDQTTRAIDAINNFVDILSYFGARYGSLGGISHRDRFQRESQGLLSRLSQRQRQIEQGYGLWNGGPVTPPTHLSPSPGPSGTFYPSPASTQYSPATTFVQHDVHASAVNSGWSNMGNTGNPNYLTTSVSDLSGGSMMAPVGLDNLGIGNFAAWETLPGGNLNARFA